MYLVIQLIFRLIAMFAIKSDKSLFFSKNKDIILLSKTLKKLNKYFYSINCLIYRIKFFYNSIQKSHIFLIFDTLI